MDHAQRITQRWEGLEARIEAKLSTLAGRDRCPEKRLLAQAAQASTASKRIHWLRKAAQAATRDADQLAACRQGCSHCCHIAVTISETEAQLIAKETGARLQHVAQAHTLANTTDTEDAKAVETQKWRGLPCTFLRDHQCSIYISRPLACRLQLNMDDDSLLCELVEGQATSVPYLNLLEHELAAALLLGTHQRYADIREWFGPARA